MRPILILCLIAACHAQRTETEPSTDVPVAVATPAVTPQPTPPPSSPAAAPEADAIVWVVEDLGVDPHPDIPAHRYSIALLIRAADREKRIAVGEATGAMMPRYQNVCHADMKPESRVYPAVGGEIAKIAFVHAGAEIFAVRSSKPGRYEVLRFVDGHAACDQEDCELPGEILTSFTTPFSGTPEESILQVGDDGASRRYACESADKTRAR